jgi:arginine deiminase
MLRSEGVEILDVVDLLDSAIRQARSRGELASWIQVVFPATASEVLPRLDELNAKSLLNLRDDHFYRKDEKGNLRPLFPGVSSMYWSRDFAVSTPRGVIIGHGKHFNRAIENAFARLMFEYAPQLADHPIVFDAEKEGVFLDGGDAMVLDEETLLLGVGNRTSPEAAEKLARKLDMNVLAVAMPPWEPSNGMRRQLLHLDSIFNLVDEKTILAVPYFLEQGKEDRDNPMGPILLGLADQVEKLATAHPDQDLGDPQTIRTTVRLMPEVGWLTRHAAGTGEKTELKRKLVDYFRERGYQVVFVGGDPGSRPVEQYVLERAMYELRWQAANVVQLRPGRVIAYAHNTHTNEALRAAGIEVLTFQGELLSIRNGGPHCLLMPLVRRSSSNGSVDLR